jgi:predicted amidohydrolase YtcJ
MLKRRRKMSAPADMIFTNGNVITVDENDRICEAVAIAGNRILHVGDAAEIEKLAGPETETVDLNGRSLLPGFIDAHCHPGSYGAMKRHIGCGPKDIRSIEDLKKAVLARTKTTSTDDWIVGRGYDQTQLAENRHPTRWDLDEAAPNHKVCIFRTCGHVLVANSAALAEVGYGPETPDPEGGKIGKDEQGEPTGVLYETARVPFWKATFFSLSELEKTTPLMDDDFIRYGITSAHDASGRNPNEMRAYQKGVEDGWLNVRMYVMARTSGGIDLGAHLLKTGLMTGFGNDKLRLGAIKLMIDGSIGGTSAAVREPYPDDSDNFGIIYMNQEELDRQVLEAHEAGFQVGVHAIGDKAVEMTIDAFEKAIKKNPRKNHRHRIEHCGMLDDTLMDRIKTLELIPVLGVPFIYELGDYYLSILGEERLDCIYPQKSLLARGIICPLSSDAPVIDPNPMNGIYSAITRKTKTGQSVSPTETVGIMDAIRGYTTHAAYAAFEEDIKGSIEPGKLADLVVLSDHILDKDPEDILNLEVDMTMVDGKIVYRKG